MCLVLPINIKKWIAETDIICYKHIMVLTYKDGTSYKDGVPDQLVTSYQTTKVEIGKSYTSEIRFSKYYEITKALHSFKSKNSCENDAKRLCDGDYAICRCIIPKGSEYYKGKFGNAISYASDNIRYDEILKVINVCS